MELSREIRDKERDLDPGTVASGNGKCKYTQKSTIEWRDYDARTSSSITLLCLLSVLSHVR